MITAKTNQSMSQLRKLNQKKYRKLNQQYIVFSPNVVKEAIKTNNYEQLITTNQDFQYNHTLVSYEVMESLVSIRPVPEVIAIVKMKPEKEITGDKVLVLDEIQDPGNLGTILRTAKAFGFNDIVLGNGCVEIYNDKVINAAQGVHFHMNIIHSDILIYLKNSTKPIITTFLDEESTNNPHFEEFNLVIGNEGHGINPLVKELGHVNYKLDIDFESLNVAVATGIIIHNLR